MRRKLALVAVVLGVPGLVAVADAGTVIEPGLPRPIEVRLEGFVGDKPAGLIPEASWIVSCQGKTYPFHVSHLDVLIGDVSPTNIITATEPYRTNYYLQADDQTLTRFASTPPGERIVLIAFLRSGSRQLLVGRIEAAEVRTPTP